MSARTRAAYALEQTATRPPAVALAYWQARQVPAWGRTFSPAVPSVHEVINAAAGVRRTAGEREAGNTLSILKSGEPFSGLRYWLERMASGASHEGARQARGSKPSRRAAYAWKWLQRIKAEEKRRLGKHRACPFHPMNFTQEIAPDLSSVERRMAAWCKDWSRGHDLPPVEARTGRSL